MVQRGKGEEEGHPIPAGSLFESGAAAARHALSHTHPRTLATPSGSLPFFVPQHMCRPCVPLYFFPHSTLRGRATQRRVWRDAQERGSQAKQAGNRRIEHPASTLHASKRDITLSPLHPKVEGAERPPQKCICRRKKKNLKASCHITTRLHHIAQQPTLELEPVSASYAWP